MFVSQRWLRWACVALLFVGADESLWRVKERFYIMHSFHRLHAHPRDLPF